MDRACTRSESRKDRDLIVDTQETFFLFAYYKLTKNLCKLNSGKTSAEVLGGNGATKGQESKVTSVVGSKTDVLKALK